MGEKKLRILLAERHPGETASILRSLYPEEQDSLELTVVSSVSTLLATLEIINPEVIFLDLTLASPDPLSAVRRVHRSAPAVPLIVLADASEKDCASRSLSQGALDYLLKGFIDSRTLERALRAALEQNTLEGLADLLRDSLTGLYIRDGFLTLGERAMETARSRGSTLVLLCMRIENLAALRAEYGPAAESSLSEVAKLLAGSFRRADILAQRSCVLPAFRNENRHAQSRHRSGGFIHVYSEPGQGSLFRVYLPAHEGMLAEGTSAKEPAPAHVEMRGSETILLAEDHESIREIARQILVNLGYRVLSACDGEEALRLCEKETPALAILDVIMPKLGGAAAASKLIALFAGLPILFTSGYSQDSENLAPTGADAHYLQKPYSPTTLGRLVREILDRVKKRGAS